MGFSRLRSNTRGRWLDGERALLLRRAGVHVAPAVEVVVDLGGGSGVSIPVSVVKPLGAQPALRYETNYSLSLLLAASGLASTFILVRSPIGVGPTAMRDDEAGAWRRSTS